jgi:hypothetical protein
MAVSQQAGPGTSARRAPSSGAATNAWVGLDRLYMNGFRDMKLFVDTNFFLQPKEIRLLPWSEICEETELYVMIPRAVQGEIDRLKQDGSGR